MSVKFNGGSGEARTHPTGPAGINTSAVPSAVVIACLKTRVEW